MRIREMTSDLERSQHEAENMQRESELLRSENERLRLTVEERQCVGLLPSSPPSPMS